MTNMIEKARANRTRALRMYALRTASVTNVFGPVPGLEDGSEAARQIITDDTRRRAHRSAPRFVSTRQIQTPHAA